LPRPQKQTVDYFSHDSNASEGKTLTILFNHFGHEGLSAWWQLLECLSGTKNHVIDIKNQEDVEFLAAKLRFTPDKLMAILAKMAALKAIDSDLFEAGLIWSQNLVDRLSPVYKARNQSLPSKPVINNPVSATNNSLTSPDNTQSKVKEIKVNNIKEPLQGAAAPFFQNPFDICSSLEDYQRVMAQAPNHVGFLVSAFKRLHPDAPQEDIDGCGGRIADWWKRKSRDTRYILGVIWDTAPSEIRGSHLNYIDAVLFPKRNNGGNGHKNNGHSNRDPGKYTSPLDPFREKLRNGEDLPEIKMSSLNARILREDCIRNGWNMPEWLK
jgi:hypothetical protein